MVRSMPGKLHTDFSRPSLASRRTYVDPNGCSCEEVRSLAESNTRCYTCDVCMRWMKCTDHKNEGKGPDHWRGQGGKGTGTDVKDFAYEKKKK